MKITDSAINAILNIMKSKELDTKTVFLEIGIFNGNLGLGFTKELTGKVNFFGELGAIVSEDVDATNIIVDYGEVNKKKGLIFLGV